MKEVLIYAAAAFVVIQTLVLLAVLAAAAKPVPQFEPEVRRKEKAPLPARRAEELELVS